MTIPMIDAGPCEAWQVENFSQALTMTYGQSWRPDLEANFREGEVRIGRTADALEILASLTDDTVTTSATADNQRLWELGDVFEIFLQATGSDEYIELHAAPNGRRLQVRFPSANMIPVIRAGERKFSEFLVTEPLFDFAVRIVSSGWQVRARVPFRSLGQKVDEVIASFGRYDYSGPTAPVISSTSRHSVLNFHRPDEWTRLALAGGGFRAPAGAA